MNHERYQYPWKAETDEYIMLALHPSHELNVKLKDTISFYVETKNQPDRQIYFVIALTYVMLDNSNLTVKEILEIKMKHSVETFIANLQE